jgi:phosphate-selective porin OprO and OprP
LRRFWRHAVIAALTASAAFGQTAGPPAEAGPKDDLAALKASIKKLEDADAKRKIDADNPNKWTVKFGGDVQADYVNWVNATPANAAAQDYFEFRRLRLTADGAGYGQFDFRLQMTLEPELAGGQAPGVRDAYFTINDLPLLGRVRIGNFFVPFGLEQVTNDRFGVFMERSIPTQGIFTADRNLGVAVYNATPDRRITWATGVFFDSRGLRQRTDDNQGLRLSGRATWLPVYDDAAEGRSLVHLGAGVLHTRPADGLARFSARPEIHLGAPAIDSGAMPAAGFTTGNLEFAAVRGSLALQSEAYLCHVDRLAADAAMLRGAYAHLSWFITGENRTYEKFGQHGAQFGRAKPRLNFATTPGQTTWGAWEAKARWSYLDLSGVATGRLHDLTLGMNWYWSDRTRVMFDWIHPVTTAATPAGAARQDLLALRFDFNW